MKCAFVVSGEVKQIMLTAESAAEKAALRLLGEPEQSITVELKMGVFYDTTRQGDPIGYSVDPCRGGYLRAFESEDSLMLVIKSQPPPQKEPE